jgi:membrane-bound lytic murein transglycosylase D
MKQSKNQKTLMTGTLVLGVALSTAWAVGRGETQPDPAPMDELIAATPSTTNTAVVWDLAVTRNDRVDTWIEFLADRNRDKTTVWMERSGKYTPMIREQLRARGMPEDLIYLAFIESGYSTKAKSHASAVGLWQFIAETGKRYGLEVNAYVDERRDPIESTGAALDYLQELYDRFGSWYLAAAAYNTGENRVARIMRQQTGSERGRDQDFWNIAHLLPRETRNYVPLMLAAGHINKEPAKYGFTDVKFQEPLSYSNVHVPGGVALSTVARAAGVTEESVEDLNPHLLRGITPPNKPMVVRVPRGSEARFAQAFETTLREDRLKKPVVTLASATRSSASHKVKGGETLSGIAKKYGTTVRALTQANGGLVASRLQVGKTLRIPTTGGSKSASVAVKKASTSSKRYHSVRRGDNLSTIADRYNLSVTRLKSLNGLRGNTIRPGQRLRIA